MSDDVKYFYINTNSKYLGFDPIGLWFDHGVAISDGDFDPYGAPLRNLRPGDILLAYTTGVGIVGIGEVEEEWDGKSHHRNKISQSYRGVPEYRIGVNWFVDSRESPINGKNAIGHTIPRFFQEIVKGRTRAKKLVHQLAGPEKVVSLTGKDGTGQEGKKQVILVNRYERDKRLRDACIKHFGCKCQICGFDFNAAYGDIGRGFIEVHHLRPLAMTGKVQRTNPQKDLIPVCSNCHAVIHLKTPPYSLDEMKKRFSKPQRAPRKG